MRKPTSRQCLLALVLIGGATLFANHLSAEIPTVKGIGKVLVPFQIIVSAPNSAFVDLALVPAAKTLVITDVILVNSTVGAATVELVDSPPTGAGVKKLPAIALPAKSNFDHQFATGIQITAGHTLRAFSVNPSGSVDVMISGYFRK